VCRIGVLRSDIAIDLEAEGHGLDSGARFPRDRAPDAWQSPRVTANEAIALLDAFLAGGTTRDDVLRAFQAAPMVDLGYARVDVHRSLRKGFPEVIYAEGKTPAQVAGIAAQLGKREARFLATRVHDEHVRALRKKVKGIVHHEQARCVTYEETPLRKRPGFIAVLAAGTSDLPVAEEAAVTADIMGNRVERIYDVGVAGLHRLLSRLDLIQQANVIIAVAGMEGALPGVVTGLVARPVIAVPTSIGYGTNLRGLTALFGMLSSCSSGMTVVNIDNGFGAGYAASQMNALAAGAAGEAASRSRNGIARKPRPARK
jgi:NCAIR mutase (PurE)-related protein